MSEILYRASALDSVDVKQRLIDLVAVPWDQEADVPWRGEIWHEVFRRGAFDGLEGHAGRILVNREHVRGDTVGKVVHVDTTNEMGLVTRVKVAQTVRGDETLQLAEEDMISASVGYYVKAPTDVNMNKRTKVREVVRAFMDHLAMVESPAYAGAQVLAVREAPPGPPAMDTPLPPTPFIDDIVNDPVFQWARSRIVSK